MNTEIEFEKTETIFWSMYSGAFATPKKINQSNKVIPESTLTKIEAGEITSTELKALAQSFPIYVYKTCVTVHGKFPKVIIERIGGYKNIIQNKNGSLEIRYNAIDNDLKNEIQSFTGSLFNRNRNSTHDNFVKSFRTENKAEAIQKITDLKTKWEGFIFKGMKARIYITGYQVWGMYYVSLIINPLLIEGSPLSIAAQMAEKPEAELLEAVQAREAEYKRRQEETENKQKAEATRKAETVKTLAIYNKERIIVKEGNIYAKVVLFNSGIYGYRFFRVEKKGSFGRSVVSSYCSNIMEVEPEKFAEYRKGKQLNLSEITETYLIPQPVTQY